MRENHGHSKENQKYPSVWQDGKGTKGAYKTS